MRRGDTPLFSDGRRCGGMTPEGESAVAGLLAGLPDAQGVLCGFDPVGAADAARTLVGGIRLLGHREPGSRSAIPRSAGRAIRYGANVEVKVIDPSANPYFATAAILGLALDGIERKLPLPPETTVDPAKLTDEQRRQAGMVLLPSSQSDGA